MSETWKVRGKVSRRSYTASPAGHGLVRLTHRSGVSAVMSAEVVTRDYETVTSKAR